MRTSTRLQAAREARQPNGERDMSPLVTGGYFDRRPGRYAAALRRRAGTGRGSSRWRAPCPGAADLGRPHTHVGPWALAAGLTDIGVYRLSGLSGGSKAGRLPYRDLDLGDTARAAVLFWLASLVPGHDLTQSFGRLMAVTWAIATGGATTAAGLLGYAQRRQALIGLSMAALPLMLGSLITTGMTRWSPPSCPGSLSRPWPRVGAGCGAC